MKYRQEVTCSVSTVGGGGGKGGEGGGERGGRGGGGRGGGREKKTVPKQKRRTEYIFEPHYYTYADSIRKIYYVKAGTDPNAACFATHTHTYTHDHAYLLSNGNDPDKDPGRVCSKSPFS